MSYRGNAANRAVLFGDRARNRPGSGGVGGGVDDDAKKYAVNTEEMMLGENDSLVNDLHAKVATLKDVSIKIDSAVQESNSLLDNMSGDFDNAGGALGATMGKLNEMVKKHGGVNFCTMVAVLGLFFFLFYWFLFRGNN